MALMDYLSELREGRMAKLVEPQTVAILQWQLRQRPEQPAPPTAKPFPDRVELVSCDVLYRRHEQRQQL
jgi:hypothetical protein